MRRLAVFTTVTLLVAVTADCFAPRGSAGPAWPDGAAQARHASAADAAAPGGAAPAADDFAEFVEYRFSPELGQITISDGVVRGRRAVASVKAKAKDLAKRGVFVSADRQEPHAYRRVDQIEGRRFETVVVITPSGDADADANPEDAWVRRVTVTVDGRRKVDCSIGQSDEGLFVYGVTIFPEFGTVEVSAVGDDGAELRPPEEFELLDGPGVITDDSLQPLPEDDGAEDAPKVEKV